MGTDTSKWDIHLIGNQAHASDPLLDVAQPPRLGLAINAAVGPIPDDWSTTASGPPIPPEVDPLDPRAQIAVLRWIAGGLQRGLAEAWMAHADRVAQWKTSDEEEDWAQAFTELFYGVSYGGTSPTYWSGLSDELERYVYRRFSGEDPAAPVVLACRHAATMTLLSRGFPLEDLGRLRSGRQDLMTALGLSPSDDCVGMQASQDTRSAAIFGKQWQVNDKARGGAWLNANGARPGSVFTYDMASADPKLGATPRHITSLLRLNPAKGLVQLFDANDAECRNSLWVPYEDVMFPSVNTENIDGNARGDGEGTGPLDKPKIYLGAPPFPYTGFGKVGDPPSGKLKEMTDHLKKTRPVGFARLVLTRRGEQGEAALLWASKMLRMYGDQEDQNYPVARYLWSLRNTPGLARIQPWWLIFAPTQPAPVGAAIAGLATSMWARGARAKTAAALVAELGRPLVADRDYVLLTVMSSMAHADLRFGRVQFLLRTHEGSPKGAPPAWLATIKALPVDQEYVRPGGVPLAMDPTDADLEYFRTG